MLGHLGIGRNPISCQPVQDIIFAWFIRTDQYHVWMPDPFEGRQFRTERCHITGHGVLDDLNGYSLEPHETSPTHVTIGASASQMSKLKMCGL